MAFTNFRLAIGENNVFFNSDFERKKDYTNVKNVQQHFSPFFGVLLPRPRLVVDFEFVSVNIIEKVQSRVKECDQKGRNRIWNVDHVVFPHCRVQIVLIAVDAEVNDFVH